MLVTCQRFGDLFLFGMVCQYSTNQNQYNIGRLKVMATYLQQYYNFEPTFIHCFCFVERAEFSLSLLYFCPRDWKFHHSHFFLSIRSHLRFLVLWNLWNNFLKYSDNVFIRYLLAGNVAALSITFDCDQNYLMINSENGQIPQTVSIFFVSVSFRICLLQIFTKVLPHWF